MPLIGKDLTPRLDLGTELFIRQGRPAEEEDPDIHPYLRPLAAVGRCDGEDMDMEMVNALPSDKPVLLENNLLRPLS